MPGLSFRDIDKVIGGLVKETEFEKEQRELQEVAPQKLNPDHYFKEFTPKNTHNPNDTYSLEEMAALTKASEKPVQSKEVVDENRYYDTYTFEEIAALIAGNYYPEMFKRKRKRRKKG